MIRDHGPLVMWHAEASDLLALELGLGVTRLHGDLDAAAIFAAFEEMGAHGLSL
jgi:hypothetical protein